ncbi:Gramicidin S synthase 1 [Chryseobacterium potabilaquae]|uniref:Gramicidin S synthase 1 n=2 Tax=Chryseobacterium potabilaquae TaxID=2675057 RepID=A0A6N4X9D1_9FLAO|nr:Gramicidin S synthase 1 [Chryseobacterium potabilaquae]
MITTVSNGRSSANISDTIGMFIQALPVVSHFTDDTIIDIMSKMQRQLLDTLSHDKYPFIRLSERHNFKLNMMLIYQGEVIESLPEFNDVPTESLELHLTTTKMPLCISITPLEDKYIIFFEYDSHLYSEADIYNLGITFQSFINSLVSASDQQKILDVPIISKKETNELIALGKGKELTYDRSETFIDLFKKQVLLYPTKTAVVDQWGKISYSKLDQMSDRLSSILIENGIEVDQFVSLMLPRCKEFLISILAVFKAGGAYVPLDSDYPTDRLQYMLNDSQSKVLITTRSLFTEKQKNGNFAVENIIFVDEIDLTQYADPINRSKADNLAYMIYTSGSTGKPKGVMIEHKSLRSFVGWFACCIELQSNDRCAQHSSFSFDASMDDLMTPLSVGAEIYILPSDLRHDMEGMYQYFNQHQITGISVSTQLGMEMLNQYNDFPIRFIVVGGEKLQPTKPSSVKIINTYGPTEFTVSATSHIIDPKREYQNIPIGRPVPNSISVIVDKKGNLLPKGMAGELCLIGRQMSRGYWQRPELTKEKFAPCPFIDEEKMYRTGDLARWNEKGELEYLGRIDNQVKLRGFRIEMGEIESIIMNYNGIQSAVVEIKEIGEVQHLCAYYTASQIIQEEILRQYLSISLTDYMIPTVFMQLDALPLNPSGKINRKELPVPEIKRNMEYETPTNKIEMDICTIFADILKLDKVGINENFFELGGTSITAIKVIIQISNLDYKINYGDLFKLKTPKELASFISPSIGISDREMPDQTFDFSNYDYTGIQEMLAKNNYSDLWNHFNLHSHGKVLLTGATGYLGIHLLHYLLINDHNEICCLVRPKSKLNSENRLKTLMAYYFSDWEKDFDTRVKIIEGDITDHNITEKLIEEHIDTVFNCAAIVKHYVAEGSMEKVNIDGVSNLISLCEAKEAMLIHISTYSVGGTIEKSKSSIFSEQDFYIGQTTDNEYVKTKFIAERIILQHVADKKLKAKIMRVGNLMGRESDGEFQINFNSNAFVNSLKSYKILNAFPLDHMTSSVELSPIDKVAEAIALLAKTPQNMTVFHPYNNYMVNMAVIMNAFNEYGYKIDIVSNDDFSSRVKSMRNDPEKSIFLQGLIHAGRLDDNLLIVEPENNYTTQILYRLGFYWNPPHKDYMNKVIEMLDRLAFFDEYNFTKNIEESNLFYI